MKYIYRQNLNARTILRNVIGCLEDWEIETENQNPELVYNRIAIGWVTIG